MIPVSAYNRLYQSLLEHRQIEGNLKLLLAETLEPEFISKKATRPYNPVKYAQKNFFSILFLALYQAIGIPAERRFWYGAINHCLRGIVTGADNLLDNEYKEMLPLNFPEEATNFKSIMHILIYDRFLFKLANQMEEAGVCRKKDRLQDALFQAIVPIGAEEAGEEGGVNSILRPAEILSSVHTYKGGKLLCLSFVAPLVLEKSLNNELKTAEKGIYSIGIALQIIDDLTDFYEDIRAGNHNYLVSSVYHYGNEHDKKRLEACFREKYFEAEGGAVEKLFPELVGRVMEDAIHEALHGFSLLEDAGFWFDQQQAYKLIKHLFELRGLKRLLVFFPSESVCSRTLDHAC